MHVEDNNDSIPALYLIDTRVRGLIQGMSQIVKFKNKAECYLATIVDIGDKNNCFLVDLTKFKAEFAADSIPVFMLNNQSDKIHSMLFSWIRTNALEMLPITQIGYPNSPGAEVTGYQTPNIVFLYEYAVDPFFLSFVIKLMGKKRKSTLNSM